MSDQENKVPLPGDVNEELAKFLGSDDDDYDDYAWALLNGGAFQSKEERLVSAADQLLSCTFSSGMFSYFSIQSEHAASAFEAFTELGLDDFASAIEQALGMMTLGTEASALEIRTASETRSCFERFVNEAKPLEEFIDESAEILVAAVAKYIRQNKDKLQRTKR